MHTRVTVAAQNSSFTGVILLQEMGGKNYHLKLQGKVNPSFKKGFEHCFPVL